MKFPLIVFLFLSFSMMGQSDFQVLDAKNIVDTFFKGFHSGDTLLMKTVMAPELPTQTVFSDRDGNNRIVNGNIEELLLAIATRPADQKWEERLLNYQVQIDGNLAHVWTPYEFWLNDSFSHCGANAFTLAKLQDGWKIIHLIDSRRRESCKN